MASFADRMFDRLLSPAGRARSERLILTTAIASYVIHLALIFLANQGIIHAESKFLRNPIAAIYTPFSFILLYEVYLLVFFLPKSISYYIGKQYEIITLIVIRRIFKDIAGLELTSNWFHVKNDLQFTYDVLTSLVLFGLIYLFYRRIPVRNLPTQETRPGDPSLERFIRLKRGIAALLVPLLLVMAVHAFAQWTFAAVEDYRSGIAAFKDMNNVFFDEFFTVLIIVDVLLLLASFFHSDRFPTIIRNSGFVISTILLKVSFSVEGIVNNTLIIGAVLFGYLILLLHDQYERKVPLQEGTHPANG